jgi:hypothetical protein
VSWAAGALLVWRYERGWVTPDRIGEQWSPPERRHWGTTEIAMYRRDEKDSH